MAAKGIRTCAATENNPTITVPSQSMGKLTAKAHRNSPIAAKNINRGINLVLLTMSPTGTIKSRPKA
ncbi:hypothetical protein D3C72_2382490 [compost metagenome]